MVYLKNCIRNKHGSIKPLHPSTAKPPIQKQHLPPVHLPPIAKACGVETQVTESTWWWLLGGALVAMELVTGTFLLLMLAAGASAGAIAAHLGFELAYQMAAAATVGVLAVLVWLRLQKRSNNAANKQQLGSQSDGQVSLDLGQTVSVTEWQANGVSQVQYRGAAWTARFQARHDQDQPAPGLHRICGIQSNTLIVERMP